MKDRTGNFKEHELNLREFFFDKETHDSLLALLGIPRHYISDDAFITERSVPRFPKNYIVRMPSDSLHKLPPINIDPKCTKVKSRWILSEEEDCFMVNPKGRFPKALAKALARVLPDNTDTEKPDTVPITVFLPKKPEQERNKLVGTEIDWKFYDLDNDSDRKVSPNQPMISELCKEPEDLYMLRLFLVFKSLGLVDVLKSKADEKNGFLDLMEALNATGSFHLVGKKHVDNEFKQMKTGPKGNRSYFTKSEHQPDTKKDKFYYFVPVKPEEKERLKLDPEGAYHNLDDAMYGDFYMAPTIALSTTKTVEYSYLNIGLKSKDKKRDVINRDHILEAMTIYCSLTSGTAVTFNVPTIDRGKGSKSAGITTPILILPKACYEEALRFKNFRFKDEIEGAESASMTKAYKVDKGSTLEAAYGAYKELKTVIIRSYHRW